MTGWLAENGVTIAGMIAIIGFLWILHRDMAGLRERMARLEGLFEGFVNRAKGPESPG